MNLAFITWNVNPEIFNIGGFGVRYYGLLFAMAFVVGTYFAKKIFLKDNKTEKDVDNIIVYIIVGTVVGARLGHCIFYDFDYYFSAEHWLEIFNLRQGGLASHGAAIGLLIAIYLYDRKFKYGYLFTLDKMVIVIALGGSLIRLGNLMNSEIVGKPSNAPTSFVFAGNFSQTVRSWYEEAVEDISITSTDTEQKIGELTLPQYTVSIEFINGISEEDKKAVLNSLFINFKENPDSVQFSQRDIVFIDEGSINLTGNVGTATMYGIPRHPSQLLEAICYLLFFLTLYYLYMNTDIRLNSGKIFGLFLIMIFTARFLIEFSKEIQEDFEKDLPLDMGQILSIPLILIGVYFYFIRTKKGA